jgi:hypothetical protein
MCRPLFSCASGFMVPPASQGLAGLLDPAVQDFGHFITARARG